MHSSRLNWVQACLVILLKCRDVQHVSIYRTISSEVAAGDDKLNAADVFKQ